MAARVELRVISNEEGNRLLRIVRRGSGSVVTWRRTQIVLLAAQRTPGARIAEVVPSDPNTVREVIRNFNGDGFDGLDPRYPDGRRAPSRCARPRRIRAAHTRPHGIRHLLCALDVDDDMLDERAQRTQAAGRASRLPVPRSTLATPPTFGWRSSSTTSRFQASVFASTHKIPCGLQLTGRHMDRLEQATGE